MGFDIETIIKKAAAEAAKKVVSEQRAEREEGVSAAFGIQNSF